MVAIDPTLQFPIDYEVESESPVYLNESNDEHKTSEYVYYTTPYNALLWGIFNKEASEAKMNGVTATTAAISSDVDNINVTLVDTHTKNDAMNTELKTDVPEVEKLINAGKYFCLSYFLIN